MVSSSRPARGPSGHLGGEKTAQSGEPSEDMSSEQAEADVEAQADAAVDLLRRLSPGNVSEHLQTIIDVNSDLTEELLARVDQPLRVARDAQANGRIRLWP